MSEKILEIANSMDWWSRDVNNEDIIEFAKLIIEKCSSLCEAVAVMAVITNEGETARKCEATAFNCSKMIKQSFGVEE